MKIVFGVVCAWACIIFFVTTLRKLKGVCVFVGVRGGIKDLILTRCVKITISRDKHKRKTFFDFVYCNLRVSVRFKSSSSFNSERS